MGHVVIFRVIRLLGWSLKARMGFKRAQEMNNKSIQIESMLLASTPRYLSTQDLDQKPKMWNMPSRPIAHQ